MEWAISLVIDEEDVIERRIERVVNFISKRWQSILPFVEDIDATGPVGNRLTKQINQVPTGFSISQEELLSMVEEDGQIFDLVIRVNDRCILTVTRGSNVDLIGTEALPSTSEIGRFIEEDLCDFDYLP